MCCRDAEYSKLTALTLASDPSQYLLRPQSFLMQHEPKDDSSDSLLAPFLTAKSESISDELLRAIIDEHADPIIKKILRSKLRVSLNGRGTQQNQDALEIAGDLRATIISTLRALKQNPNQTAIANFPDFVALKTYSACADYFREKHPQRWRLKSLLRRRLRQNPRFALWQAEDKRWYAGFSRRPETGAEAPAASEAVTHATDGKLSDAQIKSDQFLCVCSSASGRPIVFDEVVKIAAETWHIHDPPPNRLIPVAQRGITRLRVQNPGLIWPWSSGCSLSRFGLRCVNCRCSNVLLCCLTSEIRGTGE
jgi:hypothetical protein